MDATRQRRTPLRVLSILASSVLVAWTIGVVALPAGASGSACRARNLNTRESGGDLHGPIAVATTGDAISVQGICVGDYVIDRDLSFAGRATLDGGGSGTVLTVAAGVEVTLKGLLITNGDAEFGGGSATTAHSP